MTFLILGDGPAERSWAARLAADPSQRVAAVWPARPELAGLPAVQDLDEALAVPGVEAVIVGGDPETRAEALRRVAGQGLAAIVLHPPGPDADPYYQVALSRQETGAVVVPDLPLRHHPGVEAIRAALAETAPDSWHELRYEILASGTDEDPVGATFSRAVDLIRALMGEIEAVTAVGDPPGTRPTRSLVVQLRGSRDRRAEVRVRAGLDPTPARLVLAAGGTTWELELDPETGGQARLTATRAGERSEIGAWPGWDRHRATLAVLADARAGRPSAPDLRDGTRAMELTEAVRQSLRRCRTIEMTYEEVSELATFKSVMTGLGCGLLAGVLVVLPLALAGPALGMRWTVYLAWAIPPLLVLFLLVQLLRYGVRPPGPARRRPDPPTTAHDR